MAQTKQIRVCFVSPSIYPLFNPMVRTPFSDSEIQLYELARCFQDDEHVEISVLTGDYDQEEVEYYAGILVFRGQFESNKTLMQRILRRKSPLQEILDKIDADIYMAGAADSLAKSVAEYCVARKKAFIYRITHQRDCDGTFIHGDTAGQDFRWALHHADSIICQSEEQKRLLRRTEKLTAGIIPNTLTMAPLSDTLRTDVLWIGEAAEWKQPELFYRLALTIPHQSFTLLTRPNDQEYFEKLVSKTRDIPNLGFENSVPYQEWTDYLKRAKLVVNTSRFDGFPFSFTQAFAYGAPVVSLNLNPDEILDKHKIGLCAQGSEVRLAQGVLDLISYPRQWQNMSANALKYAQQVQNPEMIIEIYRKLFIKCLGMKIKKRGWKR
jgi:glycosyltransferase involved in cell wall biosynthesis